MVTVADVMTPDPVTVVPDDSLRLARDRMAEGNFRRLPVVQSGRLVGIVTDRDLRRATNSPFVLRERWYDDLILDQVKVWGAMTANPVTVEANAPLVVAAQLMRDHKIGGLPVVAGEYPRSTQQVQDACRLVGIITETDLLDYLIELLEGKAESDESFYDQQKYTQSSHLEEEG
jgi:acetoin utilization protein AcuB